MDGHKVTLKGNCCSELIGHFQQEFQNNNEAGDAIWILTSAFIIFTMQSGFGLLEAGSVSAKNECNIMIKNAVDVIFGAFGYWLCGFGLSFGVSQYANAFSGVGNFLTDSTGENFGTLYAKYFFQLSFATTSTTIVSGAMAERTNLKAYMFFSFINFTSCVFPAHWIWDDKGFLRKMGVVDMAGCGPVHLVGGVSSLVATMMLKPRHKIFEKGNNTYEMASPTNVLLGTFMLWWGWVGFNCGSTFGVSHGKWKLASRAAVTTVNASVGSALFAIVYSYWLTKDFKGMLDVSTFASGILGGLVSITAICAICRPWEAIFIGVIGGVITCYGAKVIKLLKIDDPVNCVPIHFFCGVWGLIAVGIFAEKDEATIHNSMYGVSKGGPWKFLGYQCLACVCVIAWAGVTCMIQLFITDQIFGLRMKLKDEIIGADAAEHGIKQADQSRTHGSIIRRANVTQLRNLQKYEEDNVFTVRSVSINNNHTQTCKCDGTISVATLDASEYNLGMSKDGYSSTYLNLDKCSSTDKDTSSFCELGLGNLSFDIDEDIKKTKLDFTRRSSLPSHIHL